MPTTRTRRTYYCNAGACDFSGVLNFKCEARGRVLIHFRARYTLQKEIREQWYCPCARRHGPVLCQRDHVDLLELDAEELCHASMVA